MQLYQPTITGSLSVSGSINISGSINVVGGGGTITGTASYATNADLLDGLDSTVFTLTSSFAAQTASFTAFTSSVNTFTASINSFSASVLSYTSSLNAKTSSFATTGSNTFEGIQTINSNLTVTGSITAQTLIVSTINATQSYSSGSNIFGNASSNTQTFTGSVLVSGSVLIGNNSPAGTERFGVTRDDGVTDGLHIIADFNRSGSLSAELILGYYASGSAVTGPVVYAANSQPLLFGAGSVERMRLDANGNLSLTAISPKNPDAYDSNRTFVTVQAKTGGVDRGAFMTLVGTAGGSPNYWLGRYAFASTTATYNHAAIISFTDSGGVYSGNLIFTTNANASTGDDTEKMRITSAGHIGINTSSPVSTSLTGSITIYKAYNADQASVPSTTAQTYYSNQHGLYLFGRNSGLTIVSANSEEGSIKFGNASTNVYATIGTTTGTSAVGGDMIFRVGSDTERMRITSAGAVTIAATSPSTETLTVNASAGSWAIVANGSTTTGSSFGLVVPAGTNSSDSSMIVRNTSGTNYLRVRGDGNIFLSSVVYNSTSDGTVRSLYIGSSYYLSGLSSIRASKKNIENVSNVDWLYQLNPVTFNYRKRDEEDNFTEDIYNALNYGLIAEDTAPIADFLINYDDKEEGSKKMIGIEYSRLITPMLKAIQELKTQNDDLQAQITELKIK